MSATVHIDMSTSRLSRHLDRMEGRGTGRHYPDSRRPPRRPLVAPKTTEDQRRCHWPSGLAWSGGASIPGPTAFQAAALPTELPDLVCPAPSGAGPLTAVPTGFEPATSALTGRRALQAAPRDLIAPHLAVRTPSESCGRERRCWFRGTEVSLYAIRAQTPISSVIRSTRPRVPRRRWPPVNRGCCV